jgi:hypothetical protein
MDNPKLMLQNIFPELCEFHARVESVDPSTGDVSVRFNLAFGECEVKDTDSHTWRVALNTAHVKLHPNGSEIDPIGKWGEEIKGPLVSRSVETSASEKTIRYNGEMGLKATSTELGASLGVGGAVEGKTTLTKTAEATVEEVQNRVVARPGNTWQVNSIKEDALTGTYMADQKLCGIKMSKGANRSTVGAFVIARQRDLVVELVDGSAFDAITERLKSLGSKSKKRILDILVAKGLTQQIANDTLISIEGSAVLSATEIVISCFDGSENA